jgi:hypothetical protein
MYIINWFVTVVEPYKTGVCNVRSMGRMWPLAAFLYCPSHDLEIIKYGKGKHFLRLRDADINIYII